MVTARTNFKFVNHIGDFQVMNQLEVNLKALTEWSILRMGGFSNITSPTSGAYGGDFAALRLVDDPMYTAGQVWESARRDWVWESGVNYSDPTGGIHNPNTVGTPVVNGSATSETYVVNYPLGRIIFDTAIATTATVSTQHAFRDVQVLIADEAPWWRQLQFQSFRPDDSHFGQTTSGNWSILGSNAVQMPVVIIEAVPRARSEPYELGNVSLIRQQDVLFHVFSEVRSIRNNLVDYIANQSDSTFWLFNANEIAASSAFPLDFNGDLAAGAKTYPTLAAIADSGGFRWKRCRFTNATVSELEALHPNLYEGTVRLTMEVILGTI